MQTGQTALDEGHPVQSRATVRPVSKANDRPLSTRIDPPERWASCRALSMQTAPATHKAGCRFP